MTASPPLPHPHLPPLSDFWTAPARPAQSDREINSRVVLVLEEGGKETEVTWKNLEVGDIVKVGPFGGVGRRDDASAMAACSFLCCAAAASLAAAHLVHAKPAAYVPGWHSLLRCAWATAAPFAQRHTTKP